MGLFGKSTPPPNTISDEQMADLSRRARKADKTPWLSQEATDKRQRSAEQRSKASQS